MEDERIVDKSQLRCCDFIAVVMVSAFVRDLRILAALSWDIIPECKDHHKHKTEQSDVGDALHAPCFDRVQKHGC